MQRYSPKDPDDTDDFTIQWSTLTLASGETISTATASVTAGTVSVSGSVTINGTKTITRLTGGVAGETANVRVRITTSAGRQIDETMVIPVETQ